MLTGETSWKTALADDAVVVCGAGAAGLAASLAAARCGARVLLLEAAAQLGGTVANALIHTLAGLYDSAGELLNDGLPRELIERLRRADPRVRQRKMGRAWVLQVCPNSYRQTVARWIAEEPQITTLYGARAKCVVRSDRRIIELEVTTADGDFRLRPRGVVDATGTGEVARLIDKSLVIDNDRRAAGGWIFRMRNVAASALEFPKGLAVVRALRAAADAGALAPECRHAWIDAGVFEDEAFVKLFVPLDQYLLEPARLPEIQRRALATQEAVVAFVRQFPDFANAHVVQTGSLGIRDGGRIRGRYTLSVDDVRASRTFADAACRCAWPIEYWDNERGVSIEYLAEKASYQIPMRSLQLEGVENFWAVGKCLSADRYAHASARVVGACWAMGQAAGIAASVRHEDQLEQHREHESIRPASADRPATAGASGHPRSPAADRAVVPRAR